MTAELPSEPIDAVAAWQRLSSVVVHSSPAFQVRQDEVVGPDGGHEACTHVVVPASVTVLAVDDQDRVVLTRQWVYTHGGTEWRLPGGPVTAADDDPAAAARRELADSTGLRASVWTRIGRVHGADLVCDHVEHLFRADGVTAGDRLRRRTPRMRRVPFREVVDLVRLGRLPHAGSGHAVLAEALRRTGS
ncbi:NUDIX domain-containing protein [Umezawaea endophytica]|uniref:NUDIX domain-containing protein n=1 Tax=Umezawaea endophytica TaxID=1654476 RepID=A0A9X2VIZ8_9PSEU|nr:NUDIX domain-containing protein [Umezawaea endophytica]MCS7477483.1 NUDIX domain-containing protein [Umezawaea endophytica]